MDEFRFSLKASSHNELHRSKPRLQSRVPGKPGRSWVRAYPEGRKHRVRTALVGNFRYGSRSQLVEKKEQNGKFGEPGRTRTSNPLIKRERFLLIPSLFVFSFLTFSIYYPYTEFNTFYVSFTPIVK